MPAQRTFGLRGFTLKRELIKARLPGFTLIELLIVIILFSMTTFIAAAAYLSFERDQRVKSAVLTLKNDLRFTQNKALSGDKNTSTNCTASARTLVGWYIQIRIPINS
jgi:prepilin-type N-terminal cleavage/methylation domain-containing protein